MQMSLITKVKEVMSSHTGAAHVDEIATMVMEQFPSRNVTHDKLTKNITAVLSADARKIGKKSSFSKIKNKTGGLKRGYYRLKRKPSIKAKPTPMPKVSTLYTGKAGEAAVISELLFYGYNASAMAVDDGIDVVANKDNKYFHIQVKTANASGSGMFSFTINQKSFEQNNSNQTYYIFVIRGDGGSRYYNDYLILPSNQISNYLLSGYIKHSAKLSLRISRDKRGRYMLNATCDVTPAVNTFHQIR